MSNQRSSGAALAGALVLGVWGCGDDTSNAGTTAGSGNAGNSAAGGEGAGGGGQGAQGGQGAGGGGGDAGGGGGGEGGQPPAGHLWSERYGDRALDRMVRLGVDDAGDIVMTGRFAGTIDIDGNALVSGAGQNVFAARLDPDGNAIWAKGLGDLFVWDVALDSAGNSLLTGQGLAAVNLGGGALPVDSSAFFVRYAPDGSFLSQKAFVGILPIATTYPTFAAIDDTDHIFLGGTFAGTVDFGDGSKTADGLDCWVAKLDATGTVLWSRAFGGPNSASIRDITTDDAGNVIVIGEFLGTLTAGGPVHTASATPSLFIVKYDTSGDLVFSQGYPSNVRTEMSVATDGAFIVVTGGFQGELDLGAAPLTSAGGSDIFLARYEPTGALVDAVGFGSGGTDYASHAAVDASGRVWLTGQIGGPVDFGAGPVGTDGFGAFLAGFDDTLAELFSAGYGDTPPDQRGVSVGVDAMGGVIVGATGAGTMSFGGGDLTSAGMDDVFIAKLEP